MSSFTHNPIDGRLYSEFRLSKCARAILAHVVALCPNQYGIFDPSPYGEVLDWWDGIFTRDQLHSAFEELESRNIVSRFRNDECLWLRKRFKRYLPHVHTDKHRLGIVNALDGYDEIHDEFCGLYGIQISDEGIQISDALIRIVSRCPKRVSSNLNEANLSESKLSEAKEESEAYPPDVTERERLTLAEMRRWRGYSYSFAKALDFMRRLAVDYPSLDVLDIAKAVTAWLDGKPQQKGSHARFRNFCKRQDDWDKAKLSGGKSAMPRGGIDFDASELAR